MSDLSDYRASIRRLIEAENVSEAFKEEGFDSRTADLVSGSKSFRASRVASQVVRLQDACPCDIPPQAANKKSA